ncbi:MAG: type I methionyl aminopeptidase [Opitutales bacterium]
MIKTKAEIESMREACRIAAAVLAELSECVAPGVNTWDLDQFARKKIEALGARSACHNYQVGSRRFPSFSCISVNDEVVHGIGSLKRILYEGDIVALDVVVVYGGFVGDNARTVKAGEVSPEVETLLKVTEEALYQGVAAACPGNRVGDISCSIQQWVEKRGLSVVREFVGHGVGASMHEEPQIPNFGKRKTGMKLKPGMTLAIEPMVNLGGPGVKVLDDGWTVVTADGQPSAHFEHTVLVTEKEPEILTLQKKIARTT